MDLFCPRCGRRLESTAGGTIPGKKTVRSPFFPFCSERCKLADLNSWLEGQYRIPVCERPGSEETDNPDPGNGAENPE